MTLRRRLLVVYGVGGAAPLVALAAFGWVVGTRTVTGQVDHDARQRANAMSARLGDALDLCRREAAFARCDVAELAHGLPEEAGLGPLWPWAVCVRSALVGRLPPVRRAILASSAGQPAYRVERFGFEQGSLRASVRTEAQHFLESDLHGIRDARSLQPMQPRELGWQVDFGGWSRRLALRLPQATPTWPDAILLVDISLSVLIREEEAGDSARGLVVLDRSGVILWHAEPEKRGQRLSVVEPGLAAALADAVHVGEGVRHASLGGAAYSVGYRSSAEHDWLVAVAVPHAPALAALRQVGRITLAGVATALGVALLLILRFSRRFAGGVEDLQRGAAAFASGDLDHRVGVRGTDELGHLATALNRMADDLADTNERLRVRERLAVMGELSGALAHEVKNPLHSIAVSAETLQRKGDDPAIREQCQRYILEETRRLNEFLTRFLELGRPIALHRQPTDLRDVARRAVETALAGSDGLVRVQERFPEDCPTVAVDSAQLLQALLNLALNAVQAMPKGGTLEIAMEHQDGIVKIAIADSGTGIDPAQKAALFTPFASGRAGGSGLGLAIVKRIVEAHGGSVSLKSAAGEGTTVTIDLPVSG